VKAEYERKLLQLKVLDPKPSDLTVARLMAQKPEDRTSVCYKMLGRAAVRSDMPPNLVLAGFPRKLCK
jgi:hypothetical protein